MFATKRFYAALVSIAAVAALGYASAPFYVAAKVLLAVFAAVVAVDVVLLYSKRGIAASRQMDSRFSNGDDNRIAIRVVNSYPFRVNASVIDEIPFVFQRRDVSFGLSLGRGGAKNIVYTLRPTKRGVYGFGHVRVFVSTVAGLVERRFTLCQEQSVKVYPSFLMVRRYELLAINNRLSDIGIKRVRRAGNDSEFEQIRDYFVGDDFRRINWKASARRSRLMVNVYAAERSQQVVCAIDKGRVMQQAFRSMTLLDYAINASLMLSYVAMRKGDMAGIATFSNVFDSFVGPSRNPGQIRAILESLYSQRTKFAETDFSALSEGLGRCLAKAALLVLFTNFSGMSSLRRQLPWLKRVAAKHRLLVVFFEDNDLSDFVKQPALTTEAHYQNVIAGKMINDQKQIVSVLRENGIIGLLSKPENLSVDVVNKYLELKTIQMAN